MPVNGGDARLAGTLGDDPKRVLARVTIAEEFFAEHIFEVEGDWNVVARALQAIDFSQPVIVGPHPAPPKRLAAFSGAALGPGFFVEQPPKSAKVEWWYVAPEAPYMKWFAPFMPDDEKAGRHNDARYFVPAARSSKGARLAIPERV